MVAGLDRRVVRHAIHHHLAEDRPDPVRLGSPERGLHRRLVDDAVCEHGRRPGRRERPKDRGGELVGDRGIGPRTLRRKRQPIEPGQQIQREPESRVRELRQVGVRVDEPGHEDPRPDVDGPGQQVRRGGARRSHERERPVAIDRDQPVGLVERPARRERRQDAGRGSRTAADPGGRRRAWADDRRGERRRWARRGPRPPPRQGVVTKSSTTRSSTVTGFGTRLSFVMNSTDASHPARSIAPRPSPGVAPARPRRRSSRRGWRPGARGPRQVPAPRGSWRRVPSRARRRSPSSPATSPGRTRPRRRASLRSSPSRR